MAEIVNFPEKETKNVLLDSLVNLEKLSNPNTTEEDTSRLFGSLLILPENDFELIAPTILEQYNRSLRDPNLQLTLAQMFNSGGYKLENLAGSFEEICTQIDNQFTDLSAAKRDFFKNLISGIVNAISETEYISKKIIKIALERCHDDAQVPTYAHVTDSGADIYALEDITIAPGETKLIPTGLKVAIPVGYEIQVRPKSGRSLKTKLRIANTPGTIDAGYRDEIGVIIDNIDPPIKDVIYDENHNVTGVLYGSSYTIGKGEKFAQLVLIEVPKMAFFAVDKVSELSGENRNGGFGSTGIL